MLNQRFDKTTCTMELVNTIIHGIYKDFEDYQIASSLVTSQGLRFSLKERKTNEDQSYCLCINDQHSGKWNGKVFTKDGSKHMHFQRSSK